jgi:hypothetical protein
MPKLTAKEVKKREEEWMAFYRAQQKRVPKFQRRGTTNAVYQSRLRGQLLGSRRQRPLRPSARRVVRDRRTLPAGLPPRTRPKAADPAKEWLSSGEQDREEFRPLHRVRAGDLHPRPSRGRDLWKGVFRIRTLVRPPRQGRTPRQHHHTKHQETHQRRFRVRKSFQRCQGARQATALQPHAPAQARGSRGGGLRRVQGVNRMSRSNRVPLGPLTSITMFPWGNFLKNKRIKRFKRFKRTG